MLGIIVGKISTQLGDLNREIEKKRLPSQPEQVQTVTVLRSGKVVDNNVNPPILSEEAILRYQEEIKSNMNKEQE